MEHHTFGRVLNLQKEAGVSLSSLYFQNGKKEEDILLLMNICSDSMILKMNRSIMFRTMIFLYIDILPIRYFKLHFLFYGGLQVYSTVIVITNTSVIKL